jgi:hypothetical protein
MAFMGPSAQEKSMLAAKGIGLMGKGIAAGERARCMHRGQSL